MRMCSKTSIMIIFEGQPKIEAEPLLRFSDLTIATIAAACRKSCTYITSVCVLDNVTMAITASRPLAVVAHGLTSSSRTVATSHRGVTCFLFCFFLIVNHFGIKPRCNTWPTYLLNRRRTTPDFRDADKAALVSG